MNEKTLYLYFSLKNNNTGEQKKTIDNELKA